ncbi:MAG: hypothetical protein ACMUEL_05120 [Flavobacteriales bacterium Tduv]
MLRINAQLSFSERYMEHSTKRSEFFKRLNTVIHSEGMEKNKKNISKRRGNKRNLFTVEYRYLR